MKRHRALIPLSRDHHTGLVQAVRLRRAAADGDASARLAAARDIDEYVDSYAGAAGMTVTERPKPVTLGEFAAHAASLAWTEDGSPVEVTLVRAFRGDLMYLVQCQTNERDSDGINAGCRKIVDSFRTP